MNSLSKRISLIVLGCVSIIVLVFTSSKKSIEQFYDDELIIVFQDNMTIYEQLEIIEQLAIPVNILQQYDNFMHIQLSTSKNSNQYLAQLQS